MQKQILSHSFHDIIWRAVDALSEVIISVAVVVIVSPAGPILLRPAFRSAVGGRHQYRFHRLMMMIPHTIILRPLALPFADLQFSFDSVQVWTSGIENAEHSINFCFCSEQRPTDTLRQSSRSEVSQVKLVNADNPLSLQLYFMCSERFCSFSHLLRSKSKWKLAISIRRPENACRTPDFDANRLLMNWQWCSDALITTQNQ